MSIREHVEKIPYNCSGVYKMLDLDGKILYIGKAKNIKDRLSNYLRTNSLSQRIKIMISQVEKVEIIITENEVDALILESQLIKSLKPKYNIVLRDDKTYPYILVSNHKYPRISKYRGFLNKESIYYGPYTSSIIVKNTILALQKAFLLRTCSDSFFYTRKRPCIEYDLKHCSAPCVNKISVEEYLKYVKLAHSTLSGKSKIVQNNLFKMMKIASINMDYESATIYRDRIKALQQIQEPTISNFTTNSDFIALYRYLESCSFQIISFRNGYNYGHRQYFFKDTLHLSENKLIASFITQFYKIDAPDNIYINQEIENIDILKAALKKISNNEVNILQVKTEEEKKIFNLAYTNAKENLKNNEIIKEENILENLKALKNTFNLKNVPERIEIYDNSHISGENQYGVMVVADKTGFIKKEYKKYAIKNSKPGDDYAMMQEMLYRRFSGRIKNVIPDFIFIDGGPGHLSIVSKILKKLQIDVPFSCIAKGIHRNAGKEKFYQNNKDNFSITNNDDLLLYIQSLRNEAHRFAITTHRKKRETHFISNSELSNIPKIGINRRKSLLTYFGSIEKIKASNINEISKVPGISKKLAEQILNYLK